MQLILEHTVGFITILSRHSAIFFCPFSQELFSYLVAASPILDIAHDLLKNGDVSMV